MVALLHRRDAGADVDDDAGAFVSEDGGKEAFRVGARQRELVGVANTGGLDLDHHLAGLGAFKLNGRDLQRLASFERHCGPHVHLLLLS